MNKVKIFEEFHDSVNKWADNIINNEAFKDWFDKNEEKLILLYNKYILKSKDDISLIDWAKEYFDELEIERQVKPNILRKK